MIKLLYIDLFCGAGGTTTGVERARLMGKKVAKVIACVNHDPHAIASHLANHPGAVHFTEDIRTLELSNLKALAERQRKAHQGAKLVLWASLECTNFSNAKGGQPRDADSRTLAEHLYRYIETLDPDYIQIENVREFMSWGELDENGRPVSRDKGRLYMRWVDGIKRHGYTYAWRILNSANYGAYTSRERFFGLFARKGLPVAFPEPTHQRNPERGLFGSLKTWKPVREVLDLDDAGRSIFREKKLSEKTLERIYAGLIKFVAGGKEAFLMRYNSVRPQETVRSLDDPCGVLTTANRFALVKTQWLSKQFSGDPDGKNISIEGPAGAITCKDHHAFLTTYYGSGSAVSVEGPAPTVTTKDRISLNTVQFLDQQYGNGTPASIDRPANTITTNPKFHLVSVRTQFLVNPQFGSEGSSVDRPCFTLIARMDKKPPYLVTTETGEAVIAIYPDDSPMERKIKAFMAEYGITDIYMRMLNIRELLRIQGFGDTYKLVGTSSEQKKYIGNAVETHMAAALCESLANAM
ncbi:MAG: DNA cytosine methyltransferase [Bacteroidales bacterium]|nr:DNA cytosine methyltransferase [Bacteroidales bacterium]